MTEEPKGETKTDAQQTADKFGEMFKAFGKAMSEVFNDPELKQRANEFAESAKTSGTFFSPFLAGTYYNNM